MRRGSRTDEGARGDPALALLVAAAASLLALVAGSALFLLLPAAL
jgi:hypothetical protein